MGMKETYAAVQKAVEAKDFDELRRHIADDFVMLEPEPLPYGGEWRGPEGFVALVQKLRESFGIDVVKSQISEAEGDLLVCEFTFGFTSLRTGERMEQAVIDLFRFDQDGKIARADIYYTDAVKLAAIA